MILKSRVALDPVTRPLGLDAPPPFVMYLGRDPPFEPQDVPFYPARVLGVERPADDHPASVGVPGGAYPSPLLRRVGRSVLDLRQLVYLFKARLKRQSQRSGHEAFQQLLNKVPRDVQMSYLGLRLQRRFPAKLLPHHSRGLIPRPFHILDA
jgi:hypothetical protein